MAVVVPLAPGDPRDPKGRWSLEYDSEDDVPEELKSGGSAPPPEIQVSRPNFYEVNVGSVISPITKDKQGHEERFTVRCPEWLLEAVGKLSGSDLTPHVSRNHFIIDALAKFCKVYGEHIKEGVIPAEVQSRIALHEQEMERERMELDRQWSEQLEPGLLTAWQNQEYKSLRLQLERARAHYDKLFEPTSGSAQRAIETIRRYEHMLESVIG